MEFRPTPAAHKAPKTIASSSAAKKNELTLPGATAQRRSGELVGLLYVSRRTGTNSAPASAAASLS